jgi:hypothetical protein
LTARSYAGIGFQPVSPEELKMTSEPQAPGASAVILFRQVDRDDSSTTSVEDIYVRIKILKEEGRKYADVEIPFEENFGNIRNLHARSIRPDGTIANYEGKLLNRTILKAKGVKYEAKIITLPDVQVGSIIEYYYTWEFPEYRLCNPRWAVSQDLFTRHAKFSLRPYPHCYNVHFVYHGLPPGQRPRTVKHGVVVMDVDNVPAFQTEDYMPPAAVVQAHVDFIYQMWEMPSDKAKYWKEVGERWNRSIEVYIDRRKAMEKAVSEITAPGDSQELKLQKIYARVQKMRNTSYEEERTEAETKRAKERPSDNIENVWKNGYGNNAELTWLFLALVRAAGIESYGCYIADRSQGFFAPDTMTQDKLYRRAVLVKLNGKDRYFDPGSAFTPFGLLPWSKTLSPGLRLDKEGGSWIQTPLPEAYESQVKRSAKLTLSESGDLEGRLTVTFTGLEAADRRIEENHADDVARKKYLEDEVKAAAPFGAELELTNAPDWSSSDEPLVAEFTFKLAGWASANGKRVMFPIGLFTVGEKHVFDHATRVHPIYRRFPSQKSDDLTIELPEGWKVLSTPEPTKADYPVVSYQSNANGDGGKLHISRRLVVDFVLMPLENYTPLRQFYSLVQDSDEQQVLLQQGPAAGGN